MPRRDEVGVVKDAVYQEADKWDDMAVEIDKANTIIQGLTLDELAFFAGDPATSALLHGEYVKVFNLMVTLTQGGTTEFHEIAGALRTVADLLEQGDLDSASSLKKIYG